jgi:hypothetical protein
LADGLAVFLRELMPAPEGFLVGFVLSQLSPQSEPQPANAEQRIGFHRLSCK